MGIYRVYFNQVEDAPQIWSIDEGTTETEINVQNVLLAVKATTKSNLEAKFPEPKAWFEVVGTLHIKNGVAEIR